MKRTLPALAYAAALLVGCAGAPWDDAEPRGSAREEKKEYAGVVESVREQPADGDRAGVGGIAGAVVGGSAGGSVGRGRGSTAGSVVGTVAGAVLGEAVAQSATQAGVEITVRLDEGSVVAVSQPAGPAFKSGDRVRIVSDGRTARVVKAEELP